MLTIAVSVSACPGSRSDDLDAATPPGDGTTGPASFTISTPESSLSLRPGESADVPVTLAPEGGFVGQVVVLVSLTGAPVGLTAGPLVLAPEVTSGALVLTRRSRNQSGRGNAS
jgi:hypothetical protein